jgi:hypothetical protein
MNASNDPGLATARRAFLWALGLTLLMKLVFAIRLPMTGDEAFFFQEGVAPAWGYSDHPPMVGWLLWLLRHFGDSTLALRSFTLCVTSVIALGVVDLARRVLPPERQASAWWAGAVYLAMPFSWFFVLVTTDTPLIFCMALSAWCFARAELAGPGERTTGWFAAAGLALGLAFLSKYFALLLGLAYAVWILGWRRERVGSLLLLTACALPSALIQLAFNATHGWTNIMFNLLNRNEDNAWSLTAFAVYAVMVVYLLTPWLLWQAARSRRAGTAEAGASGGSKPAALSRLLAVLWIAPFAAFAVVAMRRSVGLHWVLGFVPFFMAWVALRLTPAQLARSLRFTMLLSLPHLVFVLALIEGPLDWWSSSRQHHAIVFQREGPAVAAALTRGMPVGATLMARAYSPAAVLAYHTGRYVPVFGTGKFHARQDDLSVDFRALDGRAIRIYDRDPLPPAEFAPYFSRLSAGRFTIAGETFNYLDGEGFRYQPYRETVLQTIVERYHRIPHVLPILGSPFCERYGFASCSPGRP